MRQAIATDQTIAAFPAAPPRVRARNPFSLLLYYKRNVRRVLPITLVLVLTFFGVAVPVVIVDAITAAPYRMLSLFERTALLWPNGRQGYTTVDPERVHQLPDLAAAYPVALQWTTWPSLVAEVPGGVVAFGLAPADMQPVMDRLGTRLVAGRLPRSQSPEIAMYAAIAKRRGLRVGDKIDINAQYENLDEPYVVVGLLDGPAPTTILNKDYLVSNSQVHQASPVDRAWLLFPKHTSQAERGYPELDAALRALSQDEFVTRTFTTQSNFIGDFTTSLDKLLLVLVVLTVTVLSLAVGLLNYVYFMRRIGEFGVLLALGLTRARLMRRAVWETVTMIALTWLLGLGLAEGVCRILNATIFEVEGTAVTALTLRVFLHMLPVAVMGGLSFLITMFWQLSKLDPVSIIEQRD
ncbi:MAG TPA: ABC transporter permease [Herpetosiphonaceae bacterium]|nr:ABC transporter permease [Herpetosiphonaceae bacterium]